MAQLDSEEIKSIFSEKTKHYWGVHGLIGLGLPDHKLVAQGHPNPNHLSPKANQEIFFCLPSHQDHVTVVDGCTLATQFHGEFTYYLKGIFLLFFLLIDYWTQ
ncbi:MAG: hypothetical protein ACKOAY_12260 [Haliscomenobacter sp.]